MGHINIKFLDVHKIMFKIRRIIFNENNKNDEKKNVIYFVEFYQFINIYLTIEGKSSKEG